MALEEISFLNIFGEEVNISNLVNQMIDYYNQKLEVGETFVTDFNEGSEIRNLLEAFAVLCYAVLEDENSAGSLPFIRTSKGLYLDRIGENPFINLPRVVGKESEGIATFILNAEQETDVFIPSETLLKDSNIGLDFITDGDLNIPAGETSADVNVYCLTTGIDGNIPANTLTIINSSDVDTNLITVTNNEALSGGTDFEDDEVYRQRLLDNIRADGFGTLGYYERLAENVDGVHDVKLIDASGYTKKVIVNGFEKPTPNNVLLDVLVAFTDINNIVIGHKFTIDTPTYNVINLTFDLNVYATLDDIEDEIFAVVNGGGWDRVIFDGLDIGQNLTRDLLVDALNFQGYLAEIVSIKETGESAEFTATDIDADEVVKIGQLTINQTIVE